MTKTPFFPISRVGSLIMVLVAGMLISALAHAAPLTSETIQSFIDVQQELEDFDQRFPEVDRRSEDVHDPAHPVSSFLPVLAEFPKAESYLESVIDNHGFSDLEQWAKVGDRIYTSMMAIRFQEMAPQEKAMFDEMANAPVDDDAPAYVKQRIQEMREMSKGIYQAAQDASKEDIEAVRPFVDQLDPPDEDM